jgi:hypothetical protein
MTWHGWIKVNLCPTFSTYFIDDRYSFSFTDLALIYEAGYPLFSTPDLYLFVTLAGSDYSA